MSSRLHTYTMKRSLRFVGGVLFLLGITLGISWIIIHMFTIKDVVVDGPGMTIQLDKEKFGKNLLFLPVSTLRQQLLSTYPLLNDVRFERKFPNTLIVHLERRSAYALLLSAGNSYAIDAYGLVLGSIEYTESYPVLRFEIGILPIGSRIKDDRVEAGLSFLRGMAGHASVRSIEVRDTHSIQAKMDNTNIFLPQTGDLSAKADTLQIIMEGFRMKGTLPTVIDLRHEKPIITN